MNPPKSYRLVFDVKRLSGYGAPGLMIGLGIIGMLTGFFAIGGLVSFGSIF